MSANLIGDRGESIFVTRISQDNLFRIYFLGEKAPIVDFLLEVVGETEPYYFMVQVKSTTLGYSKKGRLKAGVEPMKLKALLRRELPTYIAGVDIDKEIVYLCPAFSKTVTYYTIPTTHPLQFSQKQKSRQVLELLKEDVINFWNSSNILNYKSQYISAL